MDIQSASEMAVKMLEKALKQKLPPMLLNQCSIQAEAIVRRLQARQKTRKLASAEIDKDLSIDAELKHAAGKAVAAYNSARSNMKLA